MKVINLSRGGGKTLELIKLSAESGDAIVCHNAKEAKRINEYAHTLNLAIPYPLTYSEFIDHKYQFKGLKGLLIDNVDMLLNSFSSIPINAITLTQQNE